MTEAVLEELWLDGFSQSDTAWAAGVSLPVLRSWRSAAPIPADRLERLQRLERAARRIREITGSDSGAALIAPRFAGSDRNGIDVIAAGCDDLLISWATGSVTTTEMLDRVFDDWRHDPVLEVFTASDGLAGLRARDPAKPETQTTAAQRVIAEVEQASDNTTTVAAARLVDVANHTGDNDDSEAMTPQELMAVSDALRVRSGTLRRRCEALDTAARSLSDAAANGAASSPQPA